VIVVKCFLWCVGWPWGGVSENRTGAILGFDTRGLNVKTEKMQGYIRYPPGFWFDLLFKIKEVKVRKCPLRRRVHHNSKDISPGLLIFGVWVGYGVEQFPIEYQSGAILAFTYIFISVSLFTMSFTRCSVTVQMFHRVLIASRGHSVIVLALTVVLIII
jgi:hypothetical protein